MAFNASKFYNNVYCRTYDTSFSPQLPSYIDYFCSTAQNKTGTASQMFRTSYLYLASSTLSASTIIRLTSSLFIRGHWLLLKLFDNLFCLKVLMISLYLETECYLIDLVTYTNIVVSTDVAPTLYVYRRLLLSSCFRSIYL